MNLYEGNHTKAVNEWNQVYTLHKGSLYHDRHWLWAIFPELFPLPPHYKGELYTKKFVCHCGEISSIDQSLVNVVNMHSLDLKACRCPACNYEVSYQSLYVYEPGKPTRGQEVIFPPRTGSIWVLDVGCGTGSMAFPLLEKNAQVRILSLDYSNEAIKVLKQRDRYDENVIIGEVCDVTNFEQLSAIRLQLCLRLNHNPTFHYATMIFVLSALENRNAIETAISNVFSVLADNGVLLIYDYTEGDYREGKFSARDRNVLDYSSVDQRSNSLGATYIRGEGTRVTFFYLKALKDLCSEFGVVHEALIRTKEEHNRKTQERWIKKYLLIKVRKHSYSLK